MLTRPCSSRLIFDADARITWPAASQVMPCASRRRRNWLPSAMRSAVGPLATRSGCAGPAGLEVGAGSWRGTGVDIRAPAGVLTA